MDGQKRANFFVDRVADLAAQEIDGHARDRVCSLMKALDLFVREAGSLFEWKDHGGVEDLVGVGIADS